MLTELTQKLIHEDANIESEGDVNDVIEVDMEAEDTDSDQRDHTADLNLQHVDETVDELGGMDHVFNEHTSNAVSLPSDVPTDESNVESTVTQEPTGETSTTSITSTMSVVSRTSGGSGISTSKASASGMSASRGRSSQKTPLSDRTPRRGSSPSSAPNAASKKRTDLKKKTVLNTQDQQHIRNMLKRNKPDSSPPDTEDAKQVSKQVKTDNG